MVPKDCVTQKKLNQAITFYYILHTFQNISVSVILYSYDYLLDSVFLNSYTFNLLGLKRFHGYLLAAGNEMHTSV